MLAPSTSKHISAEGVLMTGGMPSPKGALLPSSRTLFQSGSAGGRHSDRTAAAVAAASSYHSNLGPREQ